MDLSSVNGNHEHSSKKLDYLPFKMDHLPKAFRKKAKQELSETPEMKVKRLQEIRDMIRDDSILNDVQFHDDFLLQYLRHAKYDAKKAFARMSNFMSINRNNSSFLQQMSDQTFEWMKSSNTFTIIPHRTTDGQMIFYLQLCKLDPDQVSLAECNRYACAVLQQCIRDPMNQINGAVGVYDWKGIPYRYFRQFTPKFLYDFAYTYLNVLPLRYKAIHVINHPAPVRILWAILKALMSEKMKQRVVFHSNPETLLEFLPESAVPVKYGGKMQEDYGQASMSSWLTEAHDHHKSCAIGGHTNFY